MQNTSSPLPEITSDAYDGMTRRLFLRFCEQCQQPFYAPRHVRKRFCSRLCSGKARQNRESLKCSWCGQDFEIPRSKKKQSKRGLHFCSRACKDRAQRIGGLKDLHPPHYGNGAWSNYREQAFRVYGARCDHCGYDRDPVMLDVHHRDGNRQNNDLRNWQVLCVWCHTLKTRKAIPHEWRGKLGDIV